MHNTQKSGDNGMIKSRRTKRWEIRLNKQEFERIEKAAGKSMCQSVTSFIRESALKAASILLGE